jgi:ABC-type polysaccharide/polyol phosphate export permease
VQASYPVILATITIFISMLFSNLVTILEINSKAYIRDLLAPVNDIIFTLGLAITNFITVMAQLFVLLIVGEFRFGLNILANLPEILPIVCLLIIIFMLLGMCFAYLTSTTQTSILLTTFLALGFFMLSDAFTPLEAMNPTASAIASLNPVGIGTSMLRMTILFDVPIYFMIADLAILVLYVLAFSVALLIISKIRNKKRF